MYQNERSFAARREARAGRSRDQLAELFVLDRGGPVARPRAPAPAVACGGDAGAVAAVARGRPPASGPGTNFSVGVVRQARRDLARRAASARTPRRRRACARSACRRAGSARATRCARSPAPTAAGQAATASPIAALRAEAAELALQLVAERFHQALTGRAGSTSSSWSGLGRQHRRVGRGDERLAGAGDARGEDAAARRDRAPRARRRAGAAAATPRRSAISSASASSSASTASRCSPCEPKLRSSRAPAAMTTSSRCGPSAGDAAVEIAVEALLELRDGRRLAVVAQLRRRRDRARPRARRTAGRAARASRSRAATSAAPSSATCSVHGCERVARREAAGDAAQRRVALRDRGAVVRRQLRARGREAAERRGRSTRAARRARP